MSNEESQLTFWDHLDELRSCLIRMLLVATGFGILAFCFKEELFAVVLAPKESGFITYRLLEWVGNRLYPGGVELELFSVQLINTGLANQFLIHMKTALYAGILCTSPYLLYLLFRFVSPALYANERHYAIRLVGGGYVMFLCGTALSYFLIFPLTFRFLGTYQVSAEVENLITLDSYMDTLLLMNLMMGIVFEIPVLCWLLAKFGLLSAAFMRHFRRHAVVVMLVVAAVITPTSDAFTLLLVAFPIWMLYEASILLVQHTVSARRA